MWLTRWRWKRKKKKRMIGPFKPINGWSNRPLMRVTATCRYHRSHSSKDLDELFEFRVLGLNENSNEITTCSFKILDRSRGQKDEDVHLSCSFLTRDHGMFPRSLTVEFYRGPSRFTSISGPQKSQTFWGRHWRRGGYASATFFDEEGLALAKHFDLA